MEGVEDGEGKVGMKERRQQAPGRGTARAGAKHASTGWRERTGSPASESGRPSPEPHSLS